MKKIVTIVLALVLMFALATSAFALTVSASYKDGVLSWNASDYSGTVGVYANGEQIGAEASGSKTIALEPGTVVTFRDLSGAKDTFTVPGAATEAPTEEPTATPTVEPTATPTVEPTEEPTKAPTAAPTQKPTSKPTKTPSSDVPKTGDSTNAVYVMGGLMLLAGACLVLSRKVSK